MAFVHIILLLFLGMIGFIIFHLFRLPTPALLGAFTIIAVIRVIGLNIPRPHPYFSLFLQILLGLHVGIRINREVCKQLYRLIKPVLLTSAWSIGITISIGFLLFVMTTLDLRTALLGASPAGIDVMTMVAFSIGADTATVGLLQVIRLSLTLILFPLLFKHNSNEDGKSEGIANRSKHLFGSFFKKGIKGFNRELVALGSPPVVRTICIATAGGCLGYFLKLPAGGMLGALFSTAAAAVAGIKVKPPRPYMRVLMQIGIGTVIGFNLSREVLFNLQKMFFPVIIVSMLIIFLSLGLGKVLQKITGWERAACYLAAAPGGFTPMILLATELDARPFEVSILHLARLLTIECVVPFLVLFF